MTLLAWADLRARASVKRSATWKSLQYVLECELGAAAVQRGFFSREEDGGTDATPFDRDEAWQRVVAMPAGAMVHLYVTPGRE